MIEEMPVKYRARVDGARSFFTHCAKASVSWQLSVAAGLMEMPPESFLSLTGWAMPQDFPLPAAFALGDGHAARPLRFGDRVLDARHVGDALFPDRFGLRLCLAGHTEIARLRFGDLEFFFLRERERFGAVLIARKLLDAAQGALRVRRRHQIAGRRGGFDHRQRRGGWRERQHFGRRNRISAAGDHDCRHPGKRHQASSERATMKLIYTLAPT